MYGGILVMQYCVDLLLNANIGRGADIGTVQKLNFGKNPLCGAKLCVKPSYLCEGNLEKASN